MLFRFSKFQKQLSLNEILEELEQNEEEEVPDSIVIMPPENCNAEVTDEDSGDEDFVLLQNLPGSQLRAPAEVEHGDSSDDNDDYLSLAQLSKRRRIDPIGEKDVSGSVSAHPEKNASAMNQVEEPMPSTSKSTPNVSSFKNKV